MRKYKNELGDVAEYRTNKAVVSDCSSAIRLPYTYGIVE